MAAELNAVSQPGQHVLVGQNHDSWVVAHASQAMVSAGSGRTALPTAAFG